MLRPQARQQLRSRGNEHGLTCGRLTFLDQQPTEARFGAGRPPIAGACQTRIKLQSSAKLDLSIRKLSATQEYFADQLARRGHIEMAGRQRLRVNHEGSARVA